MMMVMMMQFLSIFSTSLSASRAFSCPSMTAWSMETLPTGMLTQAHDSISACGTFVSFLFIYTVTNNQLTPCISCDTAVWVDIFSAIKLKKMFLETSNNVAKRFDTVPVCLLEHWPIRVVYFSFEWFCFSKETLDSARVYLVNIIKQELPLLPP